MRESSVHSGKALLALSFHQRGKKCSKKRSGPPTADVTVIELFVTNCVTSTGTPSSSSCCVQTGFPSVLGQMFPDESAPSSFSGNGFTCSFLVTIKLSSN